MDPRQFYNIAAADYDLRHESPATRLVRKKEKEMIENFSSGLILDFGCGSGHHLSPGFIGLDISEGMLRVSRKKSSLLVQANEQIPFKNNSFATVHAFFTVLNMANPAKAADEFFRVLKPGGLILLSVASIFENPGRKEKTFRASGSRLKINLFSLEEIKSIFHEFSLEHFDSIFSSVRPEWGNFNQFSEAELSLLEKERPSENARIYFLAFRKP